MDFYNMKKRSLTFLDFCSKTNECMIYLHLYLSSKTLFDAPTYVMKEVRRK